MRRTLGLAVVMVVLGWGQLPARAATIQRIGTLATSIQDLAVTAGTYDIEFEYGGYDTVFGGNAFSDAYEIATEIASLFNTDGTIDGVWDIGFPPETVYFIPESSVGPEFDDATSTAWCFGCIAPGWVDAWAGPPGRTIGSPGAVIWAVPTLQSSTAVPEPTTSTALLLLLGTVLTVAGRRYLPAEG